MTDKVHALSKWLKEPASWLSLIATAVSATTFFLVYANPGELKVLLPDRVGIAAEPSLAAAIPLVFTNTGAARTHRHVVETSASLVFVPQGQEQPRSIPLRWVLELQFVSRLEFYRKYPNPAAEETDTVDDHIEYLSRAFPFHLAGGTSLVKVYRFEPRDSSLGIPDTGPFDVQVRVRTETETLSFSGKYRCPDALDTNYSWCFRVEEAAAP